MSDNELTEDERARVAAAIEQRVDQLGIEWKDIPDRGGPSTAKVREFVRGRSHVLSAGKRRELEHALDWMYGSIGDVLAGLEPTPIDPAPVPPSPEQQSSVSTQLWTTVGDLSARLGVSLRAQAALFRWTQERLPEAEHAEHERMAGAAANPLMSASMDYLQQGMAASAARDPLAATDPDFIRLSETAKRIQQESEQADVVDDSTESGAPGQAGQTQEVSLDQGEAAAASVTSRLKAVKKYGGLHNPNDTREQGR